MSSFNAKVFLKTDKWKKLSAQRALCTVNPNLLKLKWKDQDAIFATSEVEECLTPPPGGVMHASYTRLTLSLTDSYLSRNLTTLPAPAKTIGGFINIPVADLSHINLRHNDDTVGW